GCRRNWLLWHLPHNVGSGLLYDLVAGRVELTHVIAVYQIDLAFLSSTHQKMLRRIGLIGQQKGTGRAQVRIGGVLPGPVAIAQKRSIEGHKEIAHRECPATHGQPEEALTEIGTTGFAGKPAIPCDQKNITGSIRRGCCATGPDATLSRVGSRVEDGHLRQRSG